MELVRRIERALADAGVVWADEEAWRIVEAAAGRRRAALVAGDDLGDDERERALTLARRRAAGEPLQYVTGVSGFRRLELGVGPGVFVPRPETEVVAERAMERLPRGGVLVDVGTGSGAIALSVAHERPDARVLATETSPAAASWAARNRSALGLDVELLAGDLLEPLPASLRGAVDVVVSNPPYVPSTARDALPRDVVDYEPHDALFAGEDGTELHDRVAAAARPWLRRGGWLVLEIGYDQRAAALRILSERSYADARVLPDLAGRARVVEGRAA
ncbi:MAG TPA: peptide chain release factor N(5)-glutamine methyltransferase [Actinomycetota bacterium]|nr:peptide chain release factor N(5)-glutamine methyltransferase [Actinomycetota bacterium]